MNDTLIIVPTYNEIENVDPLSVAVCSACPTADLLFVDDHSPDGTGERIDELIQNNPRIHVLHRKTKAGLGRAYVAGFRWALQREYRYIFEMDADLSHRPADVPRLLEAAKGADIALGSRYVCGIRVVNWPLSRLVLSKGAAIYV
ncbi:MAG: glycosyltransferase, partial [Kiritimatiellia bacterium]|nr:glycosyltransferase [Kiritimatiellia bacterium]